MPYKENIASEIRKLYQSAPKGTTEYYLDGYDQQDVADTVNQLARSLPHQIQETLVDYTEKASITIIK